MFNLIMIPILSLSLIFSTTQALALTGIGVQYKTIQVSPVEVKLLSIDYAPLTSSQYQKMEDIMDLFVNRIEDADLNYRYQRGSARRARRTYRYSYARYQVISSIGNDPELVSASPKAILSYFDEKRDQFDAEGRDTSVSSTVYLMAAIASILAFAVSVSQMWKQAEEDAKKEAETDKQIKNNEEQIEWANENQMEIPSGDDMPVCSKSEQCTFHKTCVTYASGREECSTAQEICLVVDSFCVP